MTMSQSKAYSECAVTGPLIAAIIGTCISSMFSRTFVPSRRILSYPVGVKKSKPSPVIWAQNSLPVPVRMTTWFSGSSPMSRNTPNQCFMHVAVEHQRTASRVQGDLQDAVFPLHLHVLVFVAVAVEHGHAPNCFRCLTGELAVVVGRSVAPPVT